MERLNSEQLLVHFVLGLLKFTSPKKRKRERRFPKKNKEKKQIMSNAGLLNGPTRKSKSWNLCYMNSIIQACVPLLDGWLHEHKKQYRKDDEDHRTTRSFAQFLTDMKNNDTPSDPRVLLKMLNHEDRSEFKIGQQHDAHNFFISLINTIRDSAFQEKFALYYRTAIQCTTCGHTRYRKDTSSPTYIKDNCMFFDITHSPKVTSLSDIISFHEQPQEIDYTCRYDGDYGCRIGKKTKAHQRFLLLIPNQAIMIVLGRRTKTKSGRLKKLDHAIYLREKEYFYGYKGDPNIPATRFSKTLYSMVVHTGREDGSSGHYLTFAKNRATQKWFQYNDDQVIPCHFSDLQAWNRYSVILCYDD